MDINHFAEDTGNNSERVMVTNGIITVPPGKMYRLTDIMGSYAGAGSLRIRKGSSSGPVLFIASFTADVDFIPSRFGTPLFLKNPSLTTPLNFVLTQQGNSPNTLLLLGYVDSALEPTIPND